MMVVPVRAVRAAAAAVVVALVALFAPSPFEGPADAADLPVLSIDDVTRAEGTGGTTLFRFTVSLSAPAPDDVTFDVMTADGTAIGTDYVTVVRPVEKISAGSKSWSFDVPVIADDIVESDEYFFVNVIGISGAVAGDTQGQGTILNDDEAGIVVSPPMGHVTSEAGGEAYFTVRLAARPQFPVNLILMSSDPTEGTVEPPSMTFDTDNWDLAKPVTVTGVDDPDPDGDVAYEISISVSGDPHFSGIGPVKVPIVNVDDEPPVPGVAVNPTAGLVTTEAGGTTTFTVVLESEPTDDVVVPLSSSDTTEGTVSPSFLVFTPADWNIPQTVTVAGVDDYIDDGDVAYTVVTGAITSGDGIYSGLDPADLSVTNLDDDVSGINYEAATLVTTEAGGTATIEVWLSSEPTDDVVIPVSSSDLTEGTVAPTSLTFTSADWDVRQTVTVTGVDDPDVDGDVAYTVTLGAPTSADPVYAAKPAITLDAVNLDDDHETPTTPSPDTRLPVVDPPSGEPTTTVPPSTTAPDPTPSTEVPGSPVGGAEPASSVPAPGGTAGAGAGAAGAGAGADGSAPNGTLVRTGGSPGVLAALAAALIGVGALVSWGARRRFS